jgi:hypothetical protein
VTDRTAQAVHGEVIDAGTLGLVEGSQHLEERLAHDLGTKRGGFFSGFRHLQNAHLVL